MTRARCARLVGLCAGVALSAPGVLAAIAPATFDCVVYPNQNTCKACANCTVNAAGNAVCGIVKKMAQCWGNQQPSCSVGTGPMGTPLYEAACP